MKPYKLFCREIYDTHPQGKGILNFELWMKKYEEELKQGYEYFNE